MEVRNQQNKSKFPVPQKKAAKSDYKIQKVSSHWIRGEMEFRGMIPLVTCVFFPWFPLWFVMYTSEAAKKAQKRLEPPWKNILEP